MVARATGCGVVTITAPSGLAFCSTLSTVRCSSLVPGGVSEKKNKLNYLLYKFMKVVMFSLADMKCYTVFFKVSNNFCREAKTQIIVYLINTRLFNCLLNNDV